MKRKRGSKPGEQPALPGVPDGRPDVYGFEGGIAVKSITLYVARPNKPAKATVTFSPDHGGSWEKSIDIQVPDGIEDQLVAIAIERARPDALDAPGGGDE